jgi:hypothetical protein
MRWFGAQVIRKRSRALRDLCSDNYHDRREDGETICPGHRHEVETQAFLRTETPRCEPVPGPGDRILKPWHKFRDAA